MFANVTWSPKNISELCLFAAPKDIHGIPGVVSVKRAPKNEHFLIFFLDLTELIRATVGTLY